MTIVEVKFGDWSFEVDLVGQTISVFEQCSRRNEIWNFLQDEFFVLSQVDDFVSVRVLCRVAEIRSILLFLVEELE